RFEVVKEKVAQLKKDIEENQNKGSFLMKLIHLKESLMRYDALGDFVPLIEELSQLEQYLEEIIQTNRKRNLEIKRELLAEAQALMNSTDWKKTSDQFKELKLKWIKTGPVEKEYEEEVEKPFNKAINTFLESRKNDFDSLALQDEENIKVYENLLLQARQAHELTDVKLAFEISKKIQKQRKESGRVPADKRKPLWDEFSRPNNRIFSTYKRAAQSAPTLSPGNLISTVDKMTRETKALADSRYSPDNLDAAKKLRAEWKKLPHRKPREAQLNARSFVFAMEVVFEKAFLNKLSLAKYDDFEEKDPREQAQIQIGILRDLLHRDQKDLETIQDNSDKFRTTGDDFENILQKKLRSAKRKIEVKNHLLKELLNK